MSGSLADKSLSALKWNYLGVLFRVGLQLVGQITLARLLGPDPFGVFAAAFLLVGLFGLVAEQGLGAALVQKKQIGDADIRFVFTRLLLGGVIVAVIAWSLAEPAAAFFGNSQMALVVQGLAPALVVQAVGIVPLSLLKRELAFRQIQILQVFSYGVGFVLVGVVLALAGAGIWSLVGAWACQTMLLTTLLLIKKRHPMRLLVSSRDVAVQGFGFQVLFTNLANWTIENIDNLLVGRIFGTRALGLYAVSYNLVKNPANHLVITLQTVLFPTAARAQDNLEGLRRAYLTVLGGVALVAMPVFFGVAALSGTVVEGLFGSKWTQAAPILAPVALAMGFHCVMAIAGPVLWGKGAASRELQVQSAVAIVLVLALLLASKWSLEAMAWAVFCVYVLRFVAMTAAVMKGIGVGMRDVFRVLTGGVVMAGPIVGALWLCDESLRALSWSAGSRLAACAVSGLVVALASALMFPRVALADELCWVARRMLGRSARMMRSPLIRRVISDGRPVAAEG